LIYFIIFKAVISSKNIHAQVTSCYVGGTTAGVTATSVQMTCPTLPANNGSYMCAV